MSGQPKVIWVSPADEIKDKHPHGQLLFDKPGLFCNFACEVVEHVGQVDDMALGLQTFLEGGQRFLEFESPHTPGKCYLTRYGAEHVIAVMPAWSDKVRPKLEPNGDGVELRDSVTGVPLVRRVR